MRNAIATVEIFALRAGESARRLTLVIGRPERMEQADPWSCRVALADLHRARTVDAPDSILAISRALELARGWLAELESSGLSLARDRAGVEPFLLE